MAEPGWAGIKHVVFKAENRAARADRFVADWRKLDSARETAYRQGNMTGMKRITAQMGGMAKSLERDPQLESLLAGRKQQLGISIGMGRSLGRELATSIGFDWGRGEGWEGERDAPRTLEARRCV